MSKLYVVVTGDRPGVGKTVAARMFAELAAGRGLSCRIESDHAVLEQMWLLGDRRLQSRWHGAVWGFNCNHASMTDALQMLVSEQLERPEQVVGWEFTHGRRGVPAALRVLDPVLRATGPTICILYIKASLQLAQAQQQQRIETGGHATADEAHYNRVYGRDSLDLFHKLLVRRYPAAAQALRVITNDGTNSYFDDLRGVISDALAVAFPQAAPTP